ncbi:MAG: nuclear transport factor 2 family protein [Pseudomonadota bacterium]
MTAMAKEQTLLDAVRVYFDAIYECNVDKLDQVFHPAASLFDADQGEVFVDPLASFRADVAARPSPAGQRQKRFDEIIAIDWLSELSAVVKLRLRSMDSVFVDHLSFVRGADGFRIVAKVWHLESTCPAERLPD